MSTGNLKLQFQNLKDYPHQYWFPAEKEGYSGVALFSKEEPIEVKVFFLCSNFLSNCVIDFPELLATKCFKILPLLQCYDA
jgi:exonuclease III